LHSGKIIYLCKFSSPANVPAAPGFIYFCPIEFSWKLAAGNLAADVEALEPGQPADSMLEFTTATLGTQNFIDRVDFFNRSEVSLRSYY
jgi:hypothetical protein